MPSNPSFLSKGRNRCDSDVIHTTSLHHTGSLIRAFDFMTLNISSTGVCNIQRVLSKGNMICINGYIWLEASLGSHLFVISCIVAAAEQNITDISAAS